MISTLITTALIIGAIFVFGFIFIRIQKREQRKQLNKQKKILYAVIQQHDLRIHQKEEINNCVFGIDRSSGRLLYLDFRDPTEKTTLIDLHMVESAKLVTVEDGIYENKKDRVILTEKRITKMQLTITLRDHDFQPIQLPLYQQEDGSQDLMSLRRRGEYWQAVINSFVKQSAANATQPNNI